MALYFSNAYSAPTTYAYYCSGGTIGIAEVQIIYAIASILVIMTVVLNYLLVAKSPTVER